MHFYNLSHNADSYFFRRLRMDFQSDRGMHFIQSLLLYAFSNQIIEDGFRKYVKWDCEPIFMLQDNGRTLKIFMDKNGKLKKQLEEQSVEIN